MKRRLLIFHPTIAPYRIDFFNDLYGAFDTRVCLQYWNLRDQTFDYDKIYKQFAFRPQYLKEVCRLGARSIWGGYWKHLDEFAPDIVLVSEFNQITIVVLLHRWLKRKKYKVISICDDSYNMVAENNDFSIFHKLARRLVVPHLDNLILVEPKVTEWYKGHYGMGICFPIIKREEKARGEYEAALPVSRELVHKHELEKKNVFLFVGRLVEIKNVDSIILAFSKLDQKKNVLVVVGDGPEREKLERLSAELGTKVLFAGRLEGEQLNAWYNVASCFVLASYQEPFGAVTNEALLAGCYVLVSNKAGSSSLVEEGVNGYTFSPMDVDELAQKMEQVQLLGNNPCAYKKVRKNRMSMGYEECMNALIRRLCNL